ncbi:MAG: hypothetical protein K0S76_1280 [Herbinix sp.]|nr:hypothetical protein [Herbinix sp.]
MQRKDNACEITLRFAAPEEKLIIHNLYSLYLHDLSEFTDDIEPDEQGLLLWDSEDLYWEKPSLHPFLIFAQEKPIGFILLSEPPYVKEGCNYCIQEFFILRKYRNKGVGKKAVNQLLQNYKGIYCIIILERNTNALSFWRKLHDYNNTKYEESINNMGQENCYYQVFGSINLSVYEDYK